MRFTQVVAAALFGFGVAASAKGALVLNASTGIDHTSGSRLGNTVPDADYTVGPGGAGQAFVGQHLVAKTDLPPTYIPDGDSTASRWVSINSGVGIQGTTVPPGTYNFQIMVDLTGFVPSTAVVPSSRSAADDDLAAIKVNGTTVFTPAANQNTGQEAWTTLPVNLGAGSFTAGVNTITFVLDNMPGFSTPLALRFEGNVTATPTPEPGGLVLAAGAGALLALRRRRSGRPWSGRKTGQDCGTTGTGCRTRPG